jgi:hypothetical protein
VRSKGTRVASVTHETQPVDATRPDGPPRRRRWVLALVLVLVVGWSVSAALLVLAARGHLADAERSLPLLRSAIGDADLDTGADLAREARSSLTSAADALGNPLLVPARAVPVLGTDLRAVTTVADRGADLAREAEVLLSTIEGLPGGLAGLAPADGVLPVQHFERLAPPLRSTADAAASAAREIEATAPSGRIPQVTDARQRLLELIVPLAAQAETAAQLTEQLPRFLGADGPRTYLFGASTPAELRGTGGFVGSIARLRIEDGRLEFGAFEQSSDLPQLDLSELAPPVEEDAARWARYGGTGLFVNLNRTPDFPSAAAAMLQHWEVAQGETLDGMLVADPFALQALLELAGPAEVPGYGITLDASTVVPFVTNEAYATFEAPDERKAVLGAVSAATLGGFLDGGGGTPPGELIATFGELVARGHLLMYAADPPVQSALRRAGTAGQLGAAEPAGHGDLVNVVANSGTASKVDYYAQRTLRLETSLLAEGAARSELVVELTNDAPTEGMPSYVIGPNNPTLDAGDNLVDLSVYLAPSARFTEVPTEADGPTFTETELGYPVHDGWIRIPSGDTVERRYAWRTEDAWRLADDGELLYDLLIQGQTVIRPTRFEARVRIPDGVEVLDPPEGAEVADGALVVAGELGGEDLHVKIRLRRMAVGR